MLSHIQTQGDYEEYVRRFVEFFNREGINCLSPIEDSWEPYFSHAPCEVCHRPLGGDRVDCNGYRPETGEVVEYSVCMACLYFSVYGQLDDQTMLDLQE